MPQMKRIDKDRALFKPRLKNEKEMSEEELQDHLDYCAATEAIDEALETHEIRSFEDFAKEMGI
jgi:hypothetical protein